VSLSVLVGLFLLGSCLPRLGVIINKVSNNKSRRRGKSVVKQILNNTAEDARMAELHPVPPVAYRDPNKFPTPIAASST